MLLKRPCAALTWMKSCLNDRTQRVAVGSVVSNSMHLQCGVPQSYVLGPRLYCILAKPISEICRRHNFSHHSYADDTQVYLVIKPLDNWKNISRRLETCLSDVSVLMSSNMLKLNQDKTELIVFAPKHHVKEFSECCLSFDGTIVTNASFVKNLGIFFDRTLCMQKQASAITKSCYFQIRNIERNRSYTSEDACKTLICSLVASRWTMATLCCMEFRSYSVLKIQQLD
jgi:hypothetical protein